MPARGKSNSPSRTKGRSASPSKKGVQGTSPSGMRARSNSPSARLRARSGSPSRMRARSGSPSRMRARSGSPSKLRGRSTSPSQARGRSSSPSRATGRSSSPSGQRKGRSTSPERRGKKMGAMNKISNSFRRMRKGDRRPPPKLDENGNPIPRKKRKIKKNLGKAYKRSTRRLGKSMRRIAPKETCSYTKIASYVIPIILLIGSAIGLVIATGNVEKLKPEILDDLIKILNNKDILESDPFAGGGSPLLRWDNGGSGGLNIEILRAVSANWETTFEDAVFDWDNGNPNAVTLTTVPIAYEFNCDQVIGKIKVCDGDYGETKWRGINEFTQDTSTGFIVSSSAKMNDFYLLDAGEDARLYTMCHEIGHGFGLPHTDETFGNPDLGNCLDYSENFAANTRPGKVNFEALLERYGAVGRSLRGQFKHDFEHGRRLSQKVIEQRREAVDKLMWRMDDNAHEDGWKLLHRTEFGEEHEMELDGGYIVRVHMLLN